MLHESPPPELGPAALTPFFKNEGRRFCEPLSPNNVYLLATVNEPENDLVARFMPHKKANILSRNADAARVVGISTMPATVHPCSASELAPFINKYDRELMIDSHASLDTIVTYPYKAGIDLNDIRDDADPKIFRALCRKMKEQYYVRCIIAAVSDLNAGNIIIDEDASISIIDMAEGLYGGGTLNPCDVEEYTAVKRLITSVQGYPWYIYGTQAQGLSAKEQKIQIYEQAEQVLNEITAHGGIHAARLKPRAEEMMALHKPKLTLSLWN